MFDLAESNDAFFQFAVDALWRNHHSNPFEVGELQMAAQRLSLTYLRPGW
jgi:hypothetical protein